MTTEKFFTFDLQRFDGEATISAASGNVKVSDGYAFSGSVASSANSAVDIVTSDDSAIQSIAGAAWIKNGSATKGAILNNVGEIASFSENGSFEVEAAGNTLHLAGVSGDTLSIYSSNDKFQQTINGANLSFTVASGEVINIYGDPDADKVTLSSASATLASNGITDNQTWMINTNDNLVYSGIQYTAVGDAATVTGTSTINASINNGAAVSVTAVGSNRINDSISVNGTVIGGAANTGSKIAEEEDNLVITTGTDGNITIGSDVASLAANSNATISAEGNEAVISSVNKLAAGGKWITNADNVALGTQEWSFSDSPATITADSNGTGVATVSFGGTATLGTLAKKFNVNDLNVNKAATWNIIGTTGEETAVFDTSGNVTLTGENITANVSVSSGNAAPSVTSANGEVLNIANGGNVSISNSDIVSVSALANGGTWNVKGTTAQIGNNTEAQILTFENDGATIAALNTDGSKIGTVSGFSGNATLNYGASVAPASLTVGNTTWTKIADVYDNTVIFDSEGAATISSEYNAQVLTSGDANLKVVGADEASAAAVVVNDVYIDYTGDADGIDLVIESIGSHEGISEINNVDTGAELLVGGNDTLFSINGTYTISNSGGIELKVESDKLVVESIMSGDNLSIAGGNVDYTLTSGTSVAATINGVDVTVGSADNISNVTLSGSSSDAISTVSLKAGDSITTSGDNKFTLYYDVSNVVGSSRYVLSANDTKISVYGGSFTGSVATVNVDGSGSTPHVTIDGIASNTTLSVTGGVYNIGKANQVTINEGSGYITIGELGNTESEDESAADSRRQREASINSAVSNASDTTVQAFQFYYNMDNPPTAVSNSSVAGYEDAEDTSPASVSVDGGINIYGNTNFRDNDLHNITLQSAAADDINIQNREGTNIWTSVIDVSGSTRNTLVAIGTGSQASAINHTVKGSSNGGIILFGANAMGDNLAQAGSVGTYLENLGGYASLIGGEGEDSIVAGAGDYVSGGGGVDYFYDDNGGTNSGGYEIKDYSITEGDVIVATKFSDNSNNMTAAQLIQNINVADSVIAITGSNAITIGGNAVIFSDAKGKDGENYNLAWAESGGGTLNASAFTNKGAVILSTQNGGAADSILGTADADTIFAGANDTINPGDGADEIYLADIDSESEAAGAVVVMDSEGKGRKEVHGFSFGFDNEDAGNSILNADIESVGFGFMQSTLLATVGSNQVMFAGTETVKGNQFDILVGDADSAEKVSVLKNGSAVTISSNDDVADHYYGIGNSTLTFSANITDSLIIDLGGSRYKNISRVAVKNENEAVILGSSGKDIVSLSGSSAAYANKTVSLGAGDDVIYSGGESTSTAGNAIFFGSTSGDGDDTIHNFGYYQGAADDPERIGADILVLNGWVYGTSTIEARANSDEIAVALGENNTLHIAGDVAPDKMIRYSIDEENIRVAKIGVTSGDDNTFTYDKEVTDYHGNKNRRNDKLIVDNSDAAANAEIWLDGSKGVYYGGIRIIDASQAENTQLTLVGGSEDNTITSGGEGTTASLWGGGYGDNILIGGEGNDVFFFLNSSSKDTISTFDTENDRIRLYDITLDMISSENNYGLSSNGGIQIKTNGGGSLTIDGDNLDGAKFEVSNGDGSYTAYTATKNSDGSWGWKNK